MPLPSSGQLSIEQIGVEFLGVAPYSLSQYYRGGGKVANSPQNVNVPASGQVSFDAFYGAQLRSEVALTIAANTNNYDVKTSAGSAYFAGHTSITVTIDSGVTVGSSSIDLPAMTVQGFATGDTVDLINNGTISGAGGPGGRGTNTVTPNNAVAGTQGGTALSASDNVLSVTNNGTIAGGGGGGGGGSGRRYSSGSGKTSTTISQGGGGGGGGAGTIAGAAGALGAGNTATYNGLAGAAGTATTGGAGGAAKNSAGGGGAGGALGAAGSTGGTGAATVRGVAAAGGATGNYIDGNANVTWIVDGTRLGGVA
jgi:hypothetical protein